VIAIRNIILLLFISLLSFAQTDSTELAHMNAKDLRKLGMHAILQGDPNSAVTFLEKSYKMNKGDVETQALLAEAYRLVRNYEEAEKMYALVYKNASDKYPEALFYEAEMQKSNGRYDKAKESYEKFKKEYKGEDREMKKTAAREIQFCDSAKNIAAIEKKIVIEHLEGEINKINVEASPLSLDENTMIYSAFRTDKKEYIIEGDTNNALVRKMYLAKKVNNKWQYSGEYEGPFNASGYNVGNPTMTPDGKRMYFTRCKPNWQGKMICAIYVTEKKGDEWSEPVKLDKKINNPKYSNTQPAVSIDPVKGNEVVYFISDNKSGKGGLDIWYFTYDVKKKEYKAPKNAGPKINTKRDEMSPFFDNETRSLFFSSQGLPGLGGFDVFKAVGDGKKFLSAENIGAPINSGADDIFYTISKNREEGFIVSNRKGAVALKNETCCDDIFSYKYTQYIHINIKGLIYADENGSKKNLSDATVELYSKDKVTGERFLIKTMKSSDLALYDTKIEANADYQLLVKKDGYLSNSYDFSTRGITSSTTLEKDIPLTMIPKEPIRIPNVKYEFDKSNILEESKIALDTTVLRLMLDNPQIVVEIMSHTDSKGNDQYNLKLSQRRAESVVQYLASKGVKGERLKAKGYGESKPVAPNENQDGSDNPDGRALNRRTDFKIIGKLDTEVINDYDDE
jgi:outer membrane protein OmpA-like peptidoglycan-associated protein